MLSIVDQIIAVYYLASFDELINILRESRDGCHNSTPEIPIFKHRYFPFQQILNNNLTLHLCVAQIVATQLRQTPQTNGCLHTDDEVSGRDGNEKTSQVFSGLRAA